MSVLRAAAALVLVAGLSACAPEAERSLPSVNPPAVEVDTPQLRKVKARIGMDDCAPGKGEAVEGGLPSMTLPCLGGGRDVDLSSLRGPLVINLWQANCGPCRKEMPALQDFHEQHSDAVAVLGVDFNDVHPGSALELAEETGVTYPSLADPGGELMAEDAFAVARRGLPAFLFVAEDGTIAGVESGGVESVGEVVELVEKHLGVKL